MRRLRYQQDSNARAADLLQRCEAALAVEDVVANVRLVGVEEQPSGRWLSVFTRIDLCRKEDIDHAPRYSYRRVKTVSEQLAGADFLSRFSAALEGREAIVCDRVSIGPFVPEGTWDAEEHPSQNNYTVWPCFYAELPLDGAKIAATVEGPFVSAHGSPYFDNIWELVADVACFRTFHGSSDTRKDNLHVFIWNYKGRFSKVSLGEKGRVYVCLEGYDLGNLVVVGRIATADDDQQVCTPAQAAIDIEPRAEPLKAELALVTTSEDIVDQWYGELQQALPPGTVTKRSPAEILDMLLKSGESATVEFKPYVRLRENPEKSDEIVETVIAMSNARGGRILIGVNDHSVPGFGPDDYRTVTRESGTEVPSGVSPDERQEMLVRAINIYAIKLRDKIQQRASKSLVLKYAIVWRDQVPVLIITVAEGADKPYLDSRDNSIWYRTNATNRRPSEDELAALFADRLAPDASE